MKNVQRIVRGLDSEDIILFALIILIVGVV
jgi:hypothetical protein